MMKVGITGGIGSGKSIVARVLNTMGYPVYLADDRSRWLTNHHPNIIQPVKKLFGEGIYADNQLKRAEVAAIVFNDKHKLQQLNQIIHPVVANDFKIWLEEHPSFPIVFKEAAILFESGANQGLDKVICVTAPQEQRLQRVTKRDQTNKEQVLSRMQNQMADDERLKLSDFVIYNDGKQFVLEQIQSILNQIKAEQP